MNREIKFRAKSLDNGGYGSKWVYGYLFKTPLTAENFEADSFQSGKNRYCISTEFGVVYEIDPETIGEFTGLKDKNGKEIYEGDIVNIYDDIGAELSMGEKFDRFEIEWWDQNDLLSNIAKGSCDIEVIGNKYEHPELIKQS